jgi:hypothetical protein
MYTNEDFMAKVEQDYQAAVKHFGETRLLGTFVMGPELHTVSVFFPTVQDIAINCAPLKAWTYESESGGHRWLDFRLVSDLICDKDDRTLTIFYTKYFVVSPVYQKLFKKMRESISAFTIADWVDGNKLNIFAEWWEKIFDHYLQFRGGVQSKIFDTLTKTEEKALIYVLETIGDEGVLSISQAIQGSGISRPVFTSLLDKLDRYQAAEIKNMGVKGTYINFYDHILSKFEIS